MVTTVDPLTILLTRIQFGLSVGVHFIFPIATLGIVLYLLIFEIKYVATGNEVYKSISGFAAKLLGLVFAMGVATGLILPFTFGTNLGGFVNFAGNIFGVQLLLEIIIAFMLESVFLGLVLFGRNRVSRPVYLMSVIFVFLGSHLSAFFIISVNSWMQTPFHSLATLASGIPDAGIDGFHLQQVINGKAEIIQSAAQIAPNVNLEAVMDNPWKILFPPSWGIRFIHTVFACWIAGSAIFAAAAAGISLKNKQSAAVKPMFRIAAVIGFITTLTMPILGHFHILMLEKWQPVENAAMEGTFKTQNGAFLYALGWVDTRNRRTFGIGIPKGLSFLDSGRFNSREEGLDDMLKKGQTDMATLNQDKYLAYSPSVQTIFQTFHFMVLLGFALLAVFGIAVYIMIKDRWKIKPWIWKLYLLGLPLPFIASELGWISVEVGRQPWLIYGLFKVSEGISVIPSSYVVFSLSLFSAVYIILFIILAKLVPRIVREIPV